jgi:hypothetical protein
MATNGLLTTVIYDAKPTIHERHYHTCALLTHASNHTHYTSLLTTTARTLPPLQTFLMSTQTQLKPILRYTDQN